MLNRLQKGQLFSSPFLDNENAVACRCSAANKIKRLIRESLKTLKTQLTACGKDLGKVAIRRRISQKDSLSPLFFVISMLPLSCICLLRDFGAGYQLGKEEGDVNHLMLMEDLKLYGRNEKEINPLVQTSRVFSSDISTDSGI